VGRFQQHGFEASTQLDIINTALVRSDLRVDYSYNTSKIVKWGTDDFTGLTEGYPLNAIFGRQVIGVTDVNGGNANGIVEPGEILRDTVDRFLGVSTAPYTYAFTPTVGFIHDRIRVSAIIDRQTGFVVHDAFAQRCAYAITCTSLIDQSTPVMEQARALGSDYYDFLVPGDFTRWRELSVTMGLPPVWRSRTSVTLQGRNLKLWTRYTGPDPESRALVGFDPSEASGIPQARSWAIRFDVTP